MDRFFHHLRGVLVAVLGLASTPLAAQSVITGFRARHVLFALLSLVAAFFYSSSAHASLQKTYDDEGEAFAACMEDAGSILGFDYGSGIIAESISVHCARAPWQGAPTGKFVCGTRATYLTSVQSHSAPCIRSQDVGIGSPSEYTFTQSCATRPNKATTWTGGDDVLVCERGCEYTNIGVGGVTACMWSGTAGNRSYSCGGNVGTTGATCTGSGTAVAGGPPSDPDRDGDGTSNDSDDAPDDPGCSTGCGPQPPPPPPEEPPPPDDGQDDGAQLAGELGPRLDAIEQAVLGLGPRFDGVRAAVEGARGDANADADGIRSALDGIRSAIVAQGPNAGSGEGPGEGDGPPDLSPLNPGPDGGQHPTLDDIVEEGDASQLLAQLDTDGWGFSRSCPANSWTQSFDLGFGTLDVSQVSGFACLAGSIIGWMLALAGMIQAAYILGRMGMS